MTWKLGCPSITAELSQRERRPAAVAAGQFKKPATCRARDLLDVETALTAPYPATTVGGSSANGQVVSNSSAVIIRLK
jgi:hypothetical protein